MDCESIDCTKIKELAFLYSDREMENDLLITFQVHISKCPHCAKETRYVTRFLAVVRKRAGRLPAPSHLRARILAVMPHRHPG